MSPDLAACHQCNVHSQRVCDRKLDSRAYNLTNNNNIVAFSSGGTLIELNLPLFLTQHQRYLANVRGGLLTYSLTISFRKNKNKQDSHDDGLGFPRCAQRVKFATLDLSKSILFQTAKHGPYKGGNGTQAATRCRLIKHTEKIPPLLTKHNEGSLHFPQLRRTSY